MPHWPAERARVPPEASRLAHQQAAFAAYLRDPARTEAPPAAPERLALYRELFFNTLRDLVGSTFPVLRAILGEAGWEALIRQFQRDHRCRTPLFPELGREFLDWLDTRPAQPPFLHELAHYEWIELALALDEAEAVPEDITPDGDPLDAVPVVSPLAWPLAYRFPVHRIAPTFQPQEPPDSPTFLLIRRDAADRIHFHEIDALTHALLQALHDECTARSGHELIERLAAGHPDSATLSAHAAERLRELRARGAICGTRRA